MGIPDTYIDEDAQEDFDMLMGMLEEIERIKEVA